MTSLSDRGHLGRRGFGALAAAGFVAASTGGAWAQAEATPDPWPVLRHQIFGTKPVGDGSHVLTLDAPYRAVDAAVVPVSMDLRAGTVGKVRGLVLVIDQNPSPLAARFTLGETSGIDSLATRVRVNDYTNMRAVAALAGGSLVGVKRFVKASGGCSAPMAQVEAGNVPLGTMQFRQFTAKPGSGLREVQFIIRHPNNSGMQMNQLTRLYIPAHYITSVKIFQGERLLLSVETGISMSENPDFRFRFRPDGAKPFRAEAVDNEGMHFHSEWPAQASA